MQEPSKHNFLKSPHLIPSTAFLILRVQPPVTEVSAFSISFNS